MAVWHTPIEASEMLATGATTARNSPAKRSSRGLTANEVTLRLIAPSKGSQNAYVESFNGRFRDE
jgi:hypothetical protein